MRANSLLSCPTLCNPNNCSPSSSSVHGDSPGKNTGVGCHVFLQEIFPTQGSNAHLLHLLHWQVGSLPVVPPEKHPFLLLNQWTGEVDKNPEIQGRKALGNASSPWDQPMECSPHPVILHKSYRKPLSHYFCFLTMSLQSVSRMPVRHLYQQCFEAMTSFWH